MKKTLRITITRRIVRNKSPQRTPKKIIDILPVFAPQADAGARCCPLCGHSPTAELLVDGGK